MYNRDELKLDHISIKVLKAAINLVRKILKMNDTRNPKQCFMKLRELLETLYKMHNRVEHLKDSLELVEDVCLLNSLSSDTWKAKSGIVIAKFQLYQRTADIARCTTFSACQFLFNQSTLNTLPYVFETYPGHISKFVVQLRLTNIHACSLTINLSTLSLFPSKECIYYHLAEKETIIYVISKFPHYNCLKEKHRQIIPINEKLDTIDASLYCLKILN